MRFSPQFLEELRARLPVSEVVGRRVKLRKAGREWKGLSPFNKEKTPSFFVNDQKKAWFDFSSGKNGSIFDFVMITEGLSFPEAVERLAAEAGMPLPKVSHEEEAREEKRRSLARRHGAGGEVLRGDARGPHRRQGARLSRRPRPRSGHAGEVPPRLCAGRALRAQGASRQSGRLGRRHGGGRPPRFGRRHPGALRSLPRSGDVSDHRPARAGDRLRRPRAGEGCAGEIPELARDAALPQRRNALQHRDGARRRRTRARRWSRSRVMST